MSDQPKPLPFVYQFIAGAVAGVSEVHRAQPSNSHQNVTNLYLDSCHVPIGCRKDTNPAPELDRYR
jgi:hypothetical protein